MPYVTWGIGPKTLLVLPGGPGSALQKGLWLLNARRLMAPYVTAGFTVWIVARRRHMPPGHTIADMADDYAQMISQEFGGRVDLVVGESYGGMIGQYLAAFHPGSFGRIALVVTAAEASDWCKDTTSRPAACQPYGGRMRDELLAIEQFGTLLEAQVLVADWRTEYNTYRPHSALSMLSPVEFARRWKEEHQPQLS